MNAELKESETSGHESLNLLLFVCCLGQFMVVLDASIVNVALPQMQRGLGLSATQLQWVINAYTVIFAGFLLTGGRFADLFGRRRVFLAGTFAFTLASLAAGVAQDSSTLLIARGVQGLGGAVLAPATLAIVFTSFTDEGQRMKAFGSWSAAAAGAGAIGALLGGIITEWASWRWVFLINLPIGVVLLLMGMRTIPDSASQESSQRIDLVGAALITAGLMAGVYGVVEGSHSGWGGDRPTVFLGVGILLILLFLVNEAKFAASPLVPLSIFRNRSVTGANIISMTSSGVLIGVFFIMTLLLQFVYNLSALETGLAYLPLAVTIVGASRWGAPMALKKYGPKPVLIAASLLAFLGLLWFSRVNADGSFWADVLGPTILFGAGQGLASASVTTAGTTNVPYTQAGLVSGLLNASRQIGGALLLAILAAVAGDLRPGGSIDPYQKSMFVASMFPLVGLAAAFLIPRKTE